MTLLDTFEFGMVTTRMVAGVDDERHGDPDGTRDYCNGQGFVERVEHDIVEFRFREVARFCSHRKT